MTFCDNLLKSFSENLKQLTKINDFAITICIFMKTVLFYTVFITEMNSACKNTLVSVYLLNFHRRQFRLILSKAIALRFSRFFQKFENF